MKPHSQQTKSAQRDSKCISSILAFWIDDDKLGIYKGSKLTKPHLQQAKSAERDNECISSILAFWIYDEKLWIYNDTFCTGTHNLCDNIR